MENYRDIVERVWRGEKIGTREADALLEWLLTDTGRRHFEGGLQREWEGFLTTTCTQTEAASPALEHILQELHARIGSQKRKKRRHRWIATSAAAAVVAITGCVWLLSPPRPHTVPPTIEGITLTLSDGSTVAVESLAGSQLGDARVEQGAIEYVAPAEEQPTNDNVRHTIDIPSGRDFRLALSDGSEVWLGGGTRLRYPVSFGTMKERRVELLGGEACFDVHADPEHPFVVESRGQAITALGTRFNVAESEGGRRVTTTLAEGAVRIMVGNELSAVLTPGRQAIFDTLTGSTQQRLVDAEEVMAWRGGFIVVENQTLEQVMDKIGAWYGMEWEIASGVPRGMEFRGKIRKLDLESTLRRMEMVSGLHMRLADGKIIVTK